MQAGGRVLNPTAVFCSDRNRYYEMLSVADRGTEADLESWCTYVLSGISTELQKVDKLTSKKFLNERILFPALHYSQQRQHITAEEAKILRLACEMGEIKAGDIKSLFSDKNDNQITYRIRKLLNNRFLSPVSENARSYVPNFGESHLIRGVIESLRENDFIGGLDD